MRNRLLAVISTICVIILSTEKVYGMTAHIKDYAKPGDNVTQVLQQLINQYSTVIIDEGRWYVSPGIKLRSCVTIKGVGAGKSVLVRDNRVPLTGGMIFLTTAVNPDAYVNKDPSDAFTAQRIAFRNIKFRDLTFDFNRSPRQYSHAELSKANIYGIGLIRAAYCSVERCTFVDSMTENCNNGYPAIVVYQSENVIIRGNHSDGITFLQAIYSQHVQISNNICFNSIGTAIATTSGTGHICENNTIDGISWKVSCMGVNSTNSLVQGNQIKASKENISCLTLGHEHPIFSASSTIARKNTLITEGCRSLIIQNGKNIRIESNTCSCIIDSSSSILNSGCIVASGQSQDIKDIIIENNHLSSKGNGTCGCITYRGTGFVKVVKNEIKANRGISILSNNDVSAFIIKNTIFSNNYTIQGNCDALYLEDNYLTDGIITTAREIVVKNNQFEIGVHHSFMGKRWESVVIEGNSIYGGGSISTNRTYFFQFDASEKSSSFDQRKFNVKKNIFSADLFESIISFMGNNNCPQLNKIQNYGIVKKNKEGF